MTVQINETERERLDRLCDTARAASYRHLGVINTSDDLDSLIHATTQHLRAIRRFEKWNEIRGDLVTA